MMDGIEAIERIRAELPEVEVVALTSVLEDAAVAGAIKAGAIGYLLKDTKAEELVGRDQGPRPPARCSSPQRRRRA